MLNVIHTNLSDSLGYYGIEFAGIFSIENNVFITYYTQKSEIGYSFGFTLKPRKTPLTKEQWDARVKQLQNVR